MVVPANRNWLSFSKLFLLFFWLLSIRIWLLLLARRLHAQPYDWLPCLLLCIIGCHLCLMKRSLFGLNLRSVVPIQKVQFPKQF